MLFEIIQVLKGILKERGYVRMGLNVYFEEVHMVKFVPAIRTRNRQYSMIHDHMKTEI